MKLKPFHFYRTFLAVAAFTVVATSSLAAETVVSTPITWPTSGWQESTPEQQGMTSNAVRRLVDFGAENDVDSVLIVRHGKLVLDTYYAPYQRGMKHAINSATKGVVGTLTGLAIKDGLLRGVNQAVVDLFPDLVLANLDADKKAIALEHLLDMTSGIDWKEPLDGKPESSIQIGRSPDWNAFVLNRPMAYAPGTAFNYNSGNSQVLSTVLTRATGKSAAEFAKERLFEPLGIADVLWRKDPQGNSTGGFGLYMHPRDMAKIGYLYLHNGMWEGRQLLPSQWTDKVFHATVDMRMGTAPAFRYANGWWTIPERGVYMAVGYHRQLVMVIPKLDLVAVLTGRTHYRLGSLIDLLDASATSNQPLPADPLAYAELLTRVKEAATEKATSVSPSSDLASKVTGRSYRFERNALGLDTLVLNFAGTSASYKMLFNSATQAASPRRVAGPIGLGGYFLLNEETADPRLAVKATWTDPKTLTMISRSVTEGIVATYTLRFREDKLDIAYQDNSGFSAELHGASSP